MPINRRDFLIISSAAVAAVPFRGAAFTQTPAPAAATRFDTIRRNVGYFTGRGGTIGWLVNGDAVVVVDTQYPDTAKICVEGLKQKSGRGIDLLFNTHHHGDHTSGNPIFRPDAKKIIAQTRVPELQKQVAQQAAAQPPTATVTPAPHPTPPVVADSTFDKVWSQEVGDETVTATHYGPGHTGGDAIVRFHRANVVHLGDLLFHDRHPRVDRAAGASIQNWMAIIETIARDMPADTIYIAGHSKTDLPVIVGRKELLRQRDYFDAVLAHVRRGIAEKQSKEQISALQALPGFEDHQASPPVLTLAGVLGVAYDELSVVSQ
ncbi:MAG: MBL fold metallo-hydrolase [Acidobacteria bacterium]|nr:MBL fold metallo-hydrolase [Acidobacteriota bacterium]MCA1652026.1 MBL fold metallo-hydrolase [Acidobacteriota bacterium]